MKEYTPTPKKSKSQYTIGNIPIRTTIDMIITTFLRLHVFLENLYTLENILKNILKYFWLEDYTQKRKNYNTYLHAYFNIITEFKPVNITFQHNFFQRK